MPEQTRESVRKPARTSNKKGGLRAHAVVSMLAAAAAAAHAAAAAVALTLAFAAVATATGTAAAADGACPRLTAIAAAVARNVLAEAVAMQICS